MSDWSHPEPPRQQPLPQYDYGQLQYLAPAQYSRTQDHRPGTVTAAVILTWVSCGVAALGCLFLVFISTSDAALDGFQQGSNSALTRETARSVLSVGGVTGLIWSVIAGVLGSLVLSRLGWARVLLVVSAGVTALVSLALILSVISAIPLIVSIVVLILLFTGGSNAWFAGRPPVATVSLPGTYQQGPPYH